MTPKLFLARGCVVSLSPPLCQRINDAFIVLRCWQHVLAGAKYIFKRRGEGYVWPKHLGPIWYVGSKLIFQSFFLNQRRVTDEIISEVNSLNLFDLFVCTFYFSCSMQIKFDE